MNSGRFTEVRTLEYPWVESYDAVGYLKLLDTYSDHQILEQAEKELLYSKIKDLILSADDKIEVPYLTTLTLANKK